MCVVLQAAVRVYAMQSRGLFLKIKINFYPPEPVLRDACRVLPEGGRVIDGDRCWLKGDGGSRLRRGGCGGERYFAQGTTCSVGAAGLSHPTDRPTDRRRRRRLIRKECGPSATLPSRRPPAVRLRMWNVKCTTLAPRAALLPTRTYLPPAGRRI